MSSVAPAYPFPDYNSLHIPAAAFEVLAYLAVVAVATVCFLLGWLPVNGAIVLTVVLLATLIVMSWINLDQGRHPCFLFLCMLMLFQGGRLIAYCLGAESQPMQVVLMLANFDPAREVQGLALLCVALAAVCIYAPSRWMFRHIAPPDSRSVQKYLPYLYLLFALTLSAQLFKNYHYFKWAQEHGGYLSIYLSHQAITSTVPFVVRVIAIIAFPTFIAIFVFEERRLPRYLAMSLYLVSAAVILAIGARGGIIVLVLVLWWVTRVKSRKPSRIVLLIIFVTVLLFIGDAVRKSREDKGEQGTRFSAINAVSIEGAPLNVTEVAIQYRSHFSPYSGSYLLHELQNAFVGVERAAYYRGRALDFDVSVLLSPSAFSTGAGVASSYIGEAYIGGGVTAVILVSLALGSLLAAFYNYSGEPVMLFLFALTLPDILIMPRAQLLDWLSVLTKNLIMVAIGLAGFRLYALITSIRGAANSSQDLLITRPTAST